MATLVFDFDGILVKSRFSEEEFFWSRTIEEALGITMAIRNEIFAREQWRGLSEITKCDTRAL